MIDTFTLEAAGQKFVAEVHYDEDHGAPWDEEDGHGDVSDWTTRAKRPGELVLSRDRDVFRYYDFAGACSKARAEGWDAPPYKTGTRRQQAARAAMADFEHLRGWAANDWHYVGVIVRPESACKCCGKSESLWGIESTDDAYLREVAEELAGELS